VVDTFFFFFQAEDGIRDRNVTGVQTCALPILFFSVVRVNCRYNEAVLELLKPEPPITNRRTGRIDKRRIRNVEYLVPTGERVFVDLTPMRDVKRLPKDLVIR